MTWLKVCDTALTHPKVLHLRGLGDKVATAEAVIGWVTLAASWSGQHNTDCYIPESAGLLAAPQHWQRHSTFAVKVGIVRRATVVERRARSGQAGWIVNVGKGEIFHLLLQEQIEINREKRNFGRRRGPKIEALLRDGDQCRYCAQTVDEYDRRGGRGRTWDHPDPDVPDVIVVACRSCNSAKRKRTVDEWVADGGLDLLLPPAERGEDVYLTETTREWLAQRDALPDDDPSSPARAGTQPVADATSSASAVEPPAASDLRPVSDLRSEDRTVTGHAAPGRVGIGSGQVGSSSGEPPPRRTRARPRGSRGRGGQPTTNPHDERSAS